MGGAGGWSLLVCIRWIQFDGLTPRKVEFEVGVAYCLEAWWEAWRRHCRTHWRNIDLG